MPSFFAFFYTLPFLRCPSQYFVVGVFVGLHYRHLGRETECVQQFGGGTAGILNVEGLPDHCCHSIARPTLVGKAEGFGTGKNDFFDFLFLFIGEFGGIARASFANKTSQIVVMRGEGSPPISDGREGSIQCVRYFFVIETIENHFAALKTFELLTG
jgi:hypothetical protein